MLKSFVYLMMFTLCLSCQNNTKQHSSAIDDSINSAAYIQEKSDSSIKIQKYVMDSIGVYYKEAGFKDYCDAVLQDEYLYLAATCIANEQEPFDEDRRMDLELKIYQKFHDKWLKENDLDSMRYERDSATEAAKLEDSCRKQATPRLNDLNPKLVQLIKTNGPDLEYNFLINYFKHIQ